MLVSVTVGGVGSKVRTPAHKSLMASSGLSAAEQRVLHLVCQAKTNKEIAAVLHISPATVKRHLEDILRKLQVKNRVEAATYSLMTECLHGVRAKCPLQLIWFSEIEKSRP
jgi:DNA-binding CsgD family transcriptional regulator